jgi:NAD+ kinase
LLKKVAIVVKSNEEALLASGRLAEWLSRKGVRVRTYESMGETKGWFARPEDFSTDTDLVVVLGGDGTLLSAARHVQDVVVPILAVNMGRMGFITEVGLDQLYTILESVLSGDYHTETRLALMGTVFRGGKEMNTCKVLNDVVINKGALARIIDMSTYVNGEFLNGFRADGLIVSTPTGSTAYNMAAGGPILHPGNESIVLTPICPFMLTNRPIILPADSVIEIEIGPDATDVILTYDGQVGFDLNPGDIVRVERSETGVCLIKSSSRSYFEILRNKLKWGDANGD